jgi:hypothetical protein
MIFHSNEEEIEQFFNIANNFHQSLTFDEPWEHMFIMAAI